MKKTFRAIAGAVVLVTAAACSKEPASVSGGNVTPPVQSPAPATATAPASATAPAPGAEQLVTELYREHDAQRSPFFQTDSKALLDRFFEASLAELIWKDVVEARDGVGALDFDPLYDGQDVEPKNLKVHPAEADGASVRVPVSFESYGAKRQLTYVLAQASGSWKISNIRYADGRTLRDVYKPLAPEGK
jgi:hypothetical protein